MDSATSQTSYTEDRTESGLVVIAKEDPKPWFHPHASDLDWHFPVIDSMHVPLGNKVLVELKRTKLTSTSGILLVEDTKETEKWNTQIAKVIALGPIAYSNRDNGQPWPEGMWVKPGDYVRVPRWGGDRWDIKVEGEDDKVNPPVIFAIFNDHEIFARVTGDPLKVKAFIL